MKDLHFSYILTIPIMSIYLNSVNPVAQELDYLCAFCFVFVVSICISRSWTQDFTRGGTRSTSGAL